MAAISGAQRTVSKVFQGCSRVKQFSGDKLDAMIENNPDGSIHLFKTMTSRLQQSNQIIVKLVGGGGPPAQPQQ
jgi:type IV pilus assembly protein PilB